MENSDKKNKKSPILYLVLFSIGMIAVILISSFYIFDAYNAFVNGNSDIATYQLVLGITGILMSAYIFARFRKRLALVSKIGKKIITTIECRKCNFKVLMNFSEGDFVFKTVDKCQKCDEPMLITSIYAEELKKS